MKKRDGLHMILYISQANIHFFKPQFIINFVPIRKFGGF